MALVSVSTVSTGDVLTATNFNKLVGNSNDLFAARRLGYQTRTSDYTVNQTAVNASASVFASSITFTADGTSTYWIEFYASQVQTGTAATNIVAIHLSDGGTTDLGRMALVETPAASRNKVPVFAKIPYTPSAGSRTINIAAYYAGGTGTINAGTGAGGTMPAWFSVLGPALA